MDTDSSSKTLTNPDGQINIPSLVRLAIDAALKCQWQDALEYNKQISLTLPDNVECLNRLAKAYMELGKYSQAKKIYHQVLELDAYNTIAQKNLQKVSTFKKDNPKDGSTHPVTMSPSFFLEEPGFTKTVSLIKLAEPQRLLILSAGSMVYLVPKNRGVSVTDLDNRYLGALPDDTAHHLLKLIKGGNKYQCFIKSIKSNRVTILIRETFRSKKFKNQASFLDTAKFQTFSSDHLSAITSGAEDADLPEEGEEVVI